MQPAVIPLPDTEWKLPPLILHPFNEHVAPSALLENSRATLMLSGLVAQDGTDPEILTRRLLTGRYAEVRMLYFLGKDILRWIEQCVECAERVPELKEAQVRAQSFAGLLTTKPPEAVKAKLTGWGVVDHGPIFSRAVGVNALFAEPPDFHLLSDEFLYNYHRYADALFRCYMESAVHRTIQAANFPFEIYASGEYSRLLESEWGGAEGGSEE